MRLSGLQEDRVQNANGMRAGCVCRTNRIYSTAHILGSHTEKGRSAYVVLSFRRLAIQPGLQLYVHHFSDCRSRFRQTVPLAAERPGHRRPQLKNPRLSVDGFSVQGDC